MGKRVLAVAVLSLGLLGMGGLGGNRDSGLPARDFRAVLTDVDGTRMEVDRLTAGGGEQLVGQRRAQLLVALERAGETEQLILDLVEIAFGAGDLEQAAGITLDAFVAH